jgi:hypothetical protein
MSIEHKDITDNNIHEPKGISTATADRVYVSDGAGSGAWTKIDIAMLEGLTGDGGITARPVVSDGAGGFVLQDAPSYGSMKIVANATVFPLTAVADTTFATSSQFTLVTGTPAPWVTGAEMQNVTFSTNKLTFAKAGVYTLLAYLNIGAFPSSTAKIALRYRVNGGSFSDLKSVVKASSASDESQIFGAGFLTLAANDYVQLYVASDVTGNLLIKDANFIASIVR